MKIEIPEHLVIDVLQLIKEDNDKIYKLLNQKKMLESTFSKRFDYHSLDERYTLTNQSNNQQYLTCISSPNNIPNDVLMDLYINRYCFVNNMPLSLILDKQKCYSIQINSFVEIKLFTKKDKYTMESYNEEIELWGDLSI